MPELPDVQLFCERAREGALDRTVETVSVRPAGMLENSSESSVRDALLGHRLTAVRRHGKHLFLRSGEARHRWLRLHFGMTGALEILEEGDDEPEHTRLRLDFRGGRRMAYVCPRTFGEIGLVDSPEDFVASRGLGPDPWEDDVGAGRFRDLLEGRRGMIKTALLDQELLAGLGHVYVDEILFQAGLHPEREVEALSADELPDIHERMTGVLATAVERHARLDALPEDWLLPRRDDGATCPRCDGTIRRSEVGGRATYACDAHQERP